MKVLGLVLLSLGLAVALPTPPKLSEPDECSKECISGVAQYGQELSILKNSDLSNYFNKINEICEVITTARKCLENCGTGAGNAGPSNNPFALESLNIVCQPETQEKIDSIKQCLHYIDSNVHEICSKECSSDHIIDETDVKEEQNPMYKKANGECATFKCMARCNVETVSTQCGKDLGKEFQGLLQQVVDTQRKDLENLKLVDIMTKTSPPECNYLYDPSVLFGGKVEEATTPAAAVHDPKEDAKSLYAQAQLQLLLKQLELTEKQDALIDRENAKLDMEMSYMAHKAEQREQRFHAAQHAIATFVPMEKMPKEHMPMETMEHGHPEPTESHPPMEEGHAQQQQPEEHAHPEEPSHPEEPHPEQMEAHPPMPMESHPEQHMPMEAHPPMEESHPQPMPSMESQQPPMRMEAHPSMPMELPHPPMDFPNSPEAMHGMPFEIMIPEMPRQHPKSSRHMPPPMILEGVPMEFVPMDGAPIDLSLDMPMMRAPRFL